MECVGQSYKDSYGKATAFKNKDKIVDTPVMPEGLPTTAQPIAVWVAVQWGSTRWIGDWWPYSGAVKCGQSWPASGMLDYRVWRLEGETAIPVFTTEDSSLLKPSIYQTSNVAKRDRSDIIRGRMRTPDYLLPTQSPDQL
jgi:hypothetical protein